MARKEVGTLGVLILCVVVVCLGVVYVATDTRGSVFTNVKVNLDPWAAGSDPECVSYLTPPPSLHCIPYGTIPPTCIRLNCNPWGYDFAGFAGNLIYTPPAGFCDYFACIPSFWSGGGYVVECKDSLYSRSGGNQGACSSDGGVLLPLFSH